MTAKNPHKCWECGKEYDCIDDPLCMCHVIRTDEQFRTITLEIMCWECYDGEARMSETKETYAPVPSDFPHSQIPTRCHVCRGTFPKYMTDGRLLFQYRPDGYAGIANFPAGLPTVYLCRGCLELFEIDDGRLVY